MSYDKCLQTYSGSRHTAAQDIVSLDLLEHGEPYLERGKPDLKFGGSQNWSRGEPDLNHCGVDRKS